jgi:hypothetical protein
VSNDQEPREFGEIFMRDFAPKIGNFFNNWGVVESCLIVALSTLLKIDQMRAKIVFAEIVAFYPKINLMRRILKTHYVDNSARSEILSLLKDTQNMGSIRDRYAHASWGFGDVDGVKKVFIIPGTAPRDTEDTFETPKAVEPATLKADVSNAHGLAERWKTFFVNSSEALQEDPQVERLREFLEQTARTAQSPWPENS